MREIKFRGIHQNSNEWEYGYYIRGHVAEVIINLRGDYIIKSDTVGQCTGLKDKNGKEIYEGDIIGFMRGNRLIGHVVYEDGVYLIKYINIEGYEPKYCGKWLNCYEVIGNIYENPDLLEVSE